MDIRTSSKASGVKVSSKGRSLIIEFNMFFINRIRQISKETGNGQYFAINLDLEGLLSLTSHIVDFLANLAKASLESLMNEQLPQSNAALDVS